MIIILKENAGKNECESLIGMLNERGVKVSGINGVNHNILGLVGDTSKLDIELIKAQPVVARVQRVQSRIRHATENFILKIL